MTAITFMVEDMIFRPRTILSSTLKSISDIFTLLQLFKCLVIENQVAAKQETR